MELPNSTVVTSENLLEFQLGKLGISSETETAPSVADKSEPEVEQQTDENKAAKPENETEQEEHKPESKIEKRFNSLVSKLKEKDEQLAVQESRLKELENKANPTKVEGKPDPEKFTDAFEYAEALAEWKTQEILAKRDNDEKEKIAKQIYTARIEAAIEEIPDYKEVLESSDLMVNDLIAEAIRDSDIGPKIAYHLAKNPDVAAELNAATPSKSLRILGRLEAQLSTPAAPVSAKPVPKPSQAPEPINPIKGGSKAIDGVRDEFVIGRDGSVADYNRLMREGKIR